MMGHVDGLSRFFQTQIYSQCLTQKEIYTGLIEIFWQVTPLSGKRQQALVSQLEYSNPCK